MDYQGTVEIFASAPKGFQNYHLISELTSALYLLHRQSAKQPVHLLLQISKEEKLRVQDMNIPEYSYMIFLIPIRR